MKATSASPSTGGRAATHALRGYQKRAVRDVERKFLTLRSVLLTEFPGAGKTHEAAEIIRRYLARGKRVLILAHRSEILKQTARKLKQAGVPAASLGFIWAEMGLNLGAPIQIASVATLVKRLQSPDFDLEFDLVVVDEAHHAQAASWRKILARYPAAKTLGLSATPERLDGKPLREFFEELIEGEPCENLIEAGWIAKPEIWTREDGWRPQGLKKTGAGDYSARSAAASMGRSTIVGGIPKAYLKHARGLPGVGFAATKGQARRLVRAFRRAGIASETLFGSDTEVQREAKLARLKNGKVAVLWTCDVLGEGWDYPGARCVILARPTASLARHIQWCGRGMRPGSRSVILDHAGNYAAHGAPWEEREWSLDGRPKQSLTIAQVDSEGRVSFLEPIEVAGRLVRADSQTRQTVCAGFHDSPCPDQVKPPRGAFSRCLVARRHGAPYRCLSCTRRHNAARRQQTVCAGFHDSPCPDQVKPPMGSFKPHAVAIRHGAPYRCLSCTRRHNAARRQQTVCAGFHDSPCPDQVKPPGRAFTPTSIAKRHGAPYRCRRCWRKISGY